MTRKTLLISLAISLVGLNACQDKPQTNPLSAEELIALNKERHVAEMTWIRDYMVSLNIPMQEGSTGFFYHLVEPCGKTPIASGDKVDIDFHIYHLTNPAFSKEITHEKKTINVDNDNAEAGIHQALRLMSTGDSAIFIMPSHLAFGLTGNQMINPNTPLLYTIRVMSDARPIE